MLYSNLCSKSEWITKKKSNWKKNYEWNEWEFSAKIFSTLLKMQTNKLYIYIYYTLKKNAESINKKKQKSQDYSEFNKLSI